MNYAVDTSNHSRLQISRCVRYKYLSRNSELSKVSAYGLDYRASIPGRSRDLSCCHYVQTGSGAHPAH